MLPPATLTQPSAVETVPLSGRALEVAEGDADTIDSGARIWDAGRALSSFMADQIPLADTRLLELGSGTGIVGLTAAASGAEVLLSDKPELMPLLRLNIEANGLLAGARAVPLLWGCEASARELRAQPFDIICGSDILYSPEQMPELLETIMHASTPGVTEVLLAYPRRYTEEIFLHAAEEHFHVLDEEEIEPAIFLSRLRRREPEE